MPVLFLPINILNVPAVDLPTSLANVHYWQGFPGPAGYIDIPKFSKFPLGVGSNPLSLRTNVSYEYLLRVVTPDGSNLSVKKYKTLYPAASFGRSSTPDDVPKNKYVPGALLGSTINYSIMLFNGIEPKAEVSGGQGVLVLLDPKGTMDDLIEESWDGAQLDVLSGPPRTKFKEYSAVGKFTTAGIRYDMRRKEIQLRDQAWMLNKAHIHDEVYDGTGGKEGIAELEGVDKPYGVGVIFNADPILIDPPRQIRQLSCSSINGIRAVRDGGAAITATGVDYASYAALAAAANASAIPLGHYSTCLAEGMIALGSIPVLDITVDFEGDADVIAGTGYVDTIGGIVRRVATGRGDLKFTDAQLDFTALNDLLQSQPGTCGWWWKTRITKAEALTEIMSSRLGWWAVYLNGLLSFGLMDNIQKSPALTLRYPYDFSGEPSHLGDYQVPRKSTYVGYQRNYYVQDSSLLTGSAIDAGDALIYGQQTLFGSPTLADFPAWLWPTADTVKVFGNFELKVDADAEAGRQQGLMGVRRELWTVSVPCSPFLNLVGKVIQINDFDRYGWSSARKFICVGMSFASGIAVTLSLWG